jgi:pimeloyl-[acyl-carrier protein] methyl ester esterase
MTALVPFHNIYKPTGVDNDTAEDLVLLHGWGLHSIAWDSVVPALLEHFRVTVIDLPGMGQSPLPNGDYDLDFVADQIRRVLPEYCHLLGWSLGGLVALKIALDEPERVQSVATVATTPRFTASDDWPTAMKPDILAKFAELMEEDYEGTLVRFLALNCKGSATMRADVELLKEILYFCGLPAQRALRGGLEILRDTDLRAELPDLQPPALMLFGENDNLVPAAVMGEIEQLAPGIQLALLRDVAHVPFVSTPDLFSRALLDFYRDRGVLHAV